MNTDYQDYIKHPKAEIKRFVFYPQTHTDIHKQIFREAMQFSFGQCLPRRSLGEDGLSERKIIAGKCAKHFTACPCESVCSLPEFD